MLLLVACALLLPRDSRADSGDTLRLLTYNIHGLSSWITGGDPEVRFPKIGELSNRFGLALLQEDFTYHDLLRRGARQEVVERGNASQHAFCPVCSGAGLTSLIRAPLEIEAIWNVPYDRCSGWIGGANDCLASKGFQLMRTRLPNGAVFYVVNTHLDAGAGDPDRAARGEQLVILRDTLLQQADGAALIVAGDLNLLAGNEADRKLFDGFRSSLGLVDSGARAAPGSSWAVLDYILFRSGSGALLEVVDVGEDGAFREDGEPLSDHPALFAEFRVSAPRAAQAVPHFRLEMPPSTGITAPVTYAPAFEAR